MRARIDISEVEATTKIRAKYLRAIENEEWDMLPGPTFVKSFLRTYADYLGIDGRLLVEEYKQRHEPLPDQAELQAIGPPREHRLRPPRPPRVPRGWLIGASVVGLLIVLIVLGSIGNDNGSTPVATRPRHKARPRPQPKPAPVVPTSAVLGLTPTSDVYVCLRNASDQLIVNETLTPGNGTRTFRSRRFKLTVGNSSLTMTVNGKRFAVQPSPTATTFAVTPTGRHLLTNDNAC